jgi:hypothetical protein
MQTSQLFAFNQFHHVCNPGCIVQAISDVFGLQAYAFLAGVNVQFESLRAGQQAINVYRMS